MYKIIIVFFALFSSSAFAECTKLIQNHKYLLKSGIEYCLEIENQHALLEMGKGTDMAEISDKDKTVFEVMYPEEQLIIQDQFIVTSFSDMYLTYNNDFIYLENTPKKRHKRNAIVSNAARSIGGTIVGSGLAGDKPEIAPEIIGGAFGAAAGAAAGPFVGSAVGSYITTDIKRRGNISRPTTRINTSRGLSSSSSRGSFSHFGGGGGSRRSCGGSCHR